jgi:predicted transcriptional regulator
MKLTGIEEHIMIKLWSLEEATVNQLLDLYEHPKPAFNTVSTQIRILEKKKIVGHKKLGRGYIYFPKISKEEYQKELVNHIVDHYFDGSRNELISYLSSNRSLSDLL